MGHDHDEHQHGHDEHQHGHDGTHDHHHHHHERAHPHPHGPHDHPAERKVARPGLAQGEGVGKVLFVDAFSGIAGDMTIAALLDLGVPMEVLQGALAQLELSGYHIHRASVTRSGIVASTFDVHVEGSHPERTYAAIDAMLCASSLADDVRALARRIFRRLAEAEANVHQTPLDEVHFHEVGGVDAIVDIVGAAAMLTWLGASVSVSPLPMGRGFVRARHGVLPLPAPAVVDCLRGVPTYPVAVEAELVTPTGAAIVAASASTFEPWPRFAPLRVGWGGGQRELSDRPNLLRLVLGEPSSEVAGAAGEHVLIAANVDDMTGELAGHALRVLLAAGALDAWATPIVMKKGRPGLTLSVLCAKTSLETLSTVLLRETSSIGLRYAPISRIERPRTVVEVSTRFGLLPVKISGGPYDAPLAKPEFDACAAAATRAGVTVREVLDVAQHAAREQLASIGPVDR